MKRIAAFAAALVIALSAAFCALALDESFALELEQWCDLEGAQSELIEGVSGLEGAVKYYVDENEHTVYMHFSYTADAMKADNNQVVVTVNVSNSNHSCNFVFDKSGILENSGADIKLAQKFGQETTYGHEFIFAFQFTKKADFTDNQIDVRISVNGTHYKVFSRELMLVPASTTKATTQKNTTTKKETTTPTVKQTTTKPATAKPQTTTGTTKFSPPEDADYFSTTAAGASDASTVTDEYEAEQIIDAPQIEEKPYLSNPAKIIIACAAVLALTGAGLIAKAAVSAKNKKKKAESPEVKKPKIDEQSKEIVDRYINDDYDVEE